jgi:hypothetical protein
MTWRKTMLMGIRRPVRSLRAMAGLMAVAAAVAACGGGGSGPGKVSLKAAVAHPCLLVSRAEARAILGPGTRRPAPGARSQCLYQVASASSVARLISVDIGPGPLPRDMPATMLVSPAPTTAGHGTQCGAEQNDAGQFSLLGPFGGHHELLIIGPSCAIDTKFARQVYLHL